MKSKFRILSLCTLMLLMTGCGNDKTSDSIVLPSTEEPPVVTTTEKKDDTVNTYGDFKKEGEKYTALKPSSKLLLDEKMRDGTFTATVSFGDKIADNGIVFLSDDEERVYYFFGRNLIGQYVLIKNDDGFVSTLKTASSSNSDDVVTLSVIIDDKEKTIDTYINDEFLFQVEEESFFSGDRIGFKAGGKGTSYEDISVVKNKNAFLDHLDNYDVAHGAMNMDASDKIISETRAAMVTSKNRTFTNGVFEADVEMGNAVSQNGLVFSLSSNKVDNYWEGNGISYYFFYITETGRACLGKTDNGKWNTIFEKVIRPFDNTKTYHMKAVKGTDGIYCYVDDILYGTYMDNTPLSGTKFGLRAGDMNAKFSNVRVHEITNPEKDISASLNIGNGSFYGLGDKYISSSRSSIMTLKDKKKKNGTLKTYLAPRGGEDNGIIFRVTRPEGKFAGNENGLSYYWFGYQANGMVALKRVENGKVVKSADKFLPWGSFSYMGYEVKIVMDNNDFYCYFDGRLAVTYHDDNPLQGEEYGFYAGSKAAYMDAIEDMDSVTKEQYDTLIFGHSYMDYWYTYQEDLEEYESIYDIGIGASVTSHWNNYTNEVIAYQPKLGIYGIGINDISSNVSPATIATNVKTMLLDIKKALPNFEVALFGVSRCPSRTGYTTQISQTNKEYIKLSETYSWIHYVEVETLFCNDNGTPLARYFTDGLHPTHEGYLMMVDALRTALA